MITRAIISIVLGALCVVGMMIPFASIPFVMLAWPLANMPPFNTTNEHVTWVFLSFIVKSPLAWLTFATYFSLLWFAVLSCFAYMKRKRDQ